MTFRRATLDDGVFILKLLREFYKKSWKDVYGIPMDLDTSMRSIDEIIHRGIFLVGPTSYAGAILTPCLWNDKAVIATVMLWYFRAAKEIRIFDALREECEKAGATHIVASSHFPHNTIGRFYAKKGLTPCEIQSIARI